MYTNVVAGIDGTDAGRDVLAVAETLAPSLKELALVHVRVLEAPVPPRYGAAFDAETRAKTRPAAQGRATTLCSGGRDVQRARA